MSVTRNNRARILKYLLDELPEGEKLSFAREYFEDPLLYEEILELENDLLDRYVRGELRDNERERFLSYLEKLPNWRSKLATAGYVNQLTENDRKSALSMITSTQSSEGSWAVHYVRQYLTPSGSFRAALAGAAVASVLILTFGLFWQRQILREEHSRDVETKRRIEEQSSDLAVLRQELEKSRAPQADQSQKGSATSSNAVQRSGRPATLHLSIDSTRAEAPLVGLQLPEAAIHIAITVDRQEYARFRGVLQTTDGRQIWHSRSLVPVKSAMGAQVLFNVPASLFSQRRYKLTLLGIGPDGSENEAAEWYLDPRMKEP